MASPEQALKSGLASALQNGEFSDFTITCGPRSFKVHKVIICAQSEYFRAACRNFKEAEKNAIELATSDTDPTCDDPEAIKCMVDFFYRFDYQPEDLLTPSTAAQAAVDSVPLWRKKGKSYKAPIFAPSKHMPRADGKLLIHARVFAAAVKYQIPALTQLAAAKFAAAIEVNRTHDSLAETISTVYTTTASEIRGLRDVVVDTLNGHDELLDSAGVAETVRGLEGLSWELFRKSKGVECICGSGFGPSSRCLVHKPTWSTAPQGLW